MKNLPDSTISSLLHSNPLDHLEARQWCFSRSVQNWMKATTRDPQTYFSLCQTVSVIIQRFNCVAIVGCCDVRLIYCRDNYLLQYIYILSIHTLENQKVSLDGKDNVS